jgi:Kef-type K+ transport system membrane component KefB
MNLYCSNLVPLRRMRRLICIFLFFSFLVVSLTKKLKVPSVVGYVILGVLLSVDLVSLLPFLSNT